MSATAHTLARQVADAQEAYVQDFLISGAFLNELCLLVYPGLTEIVQEGHSYYMMCHTRWRMC